MLCRWFLGACVGTLLVGATSPLFVRSYVPRVADPVRGVSVFRSETSMRWRREGYATTKIGPLGMPGVSSKALPEGSAIGSGATARSVALWGDSQAEGVCVADDQKVSQLVGYASGDRFRMACFARSGDDCNDWLWQIETIGDTHSSQLEFEAHVFLVVEWSDWCVDVREVTEDPDGDWGNQVSRYVPAFLIQASRNVVTRGFDDQPRVLRFRPGPIPKNSPPQPTTMASVESVAGRVAKVAVQLTRLKEVSSVPCIFIYAPRLPYVSGGRIQSVDEDEELFKSVVPVCERLGYGVIDLRKELQSSVAAGAWPRGFHNGQFGLGHYNVVGNRIIAEAIVNQMESVFAGGGSERENPSAGSSRETTQ